MTLTELRAQRAKRTASIAVREKLEHALEELAAGNIDKGMHLVAEVIDLLVAAAA
jgi:hypothetical protein